MARTRAKLAVVATALLLATVAAIGVATYFVMESAGKQSQRLPDGSVLVLNRVGFANTNRFIHGSFLEKLLGDAISTNGVQLWKLRLARPTEQIFRAPPGQTELVVELRILGTNLANHPLVKPAFYREFRCMIRGENGIEYAEEFWLDRFRSERGGFFGYMRADSYPRDSRWLWLRVERRESANQGGPWKSVAEFKFENKAHATIQPWAAEPAPATKAIRGLDFTLNEIIVVTQAYSPRDIWNHDISTPFQVSSNGMTLTNWGAPYIHVGDASGNWNYHLQSHRSLDPRFVWKLEVDFEPQSNLPPGSILIVDIPKSPTQITTNLLNVPVTLTWGGNYISASMPTNRPELALKFISVTDDQGAQCSEASGSWSQQSFCKGDFYRVSGGMMTKADKVTKVTFAIVPNVRATFYAQPRVVAREVK